MIELPGSVALSERGSPFRLEQIAAILVASSPSSSIESTIASPISWGSTLVAMLGRKL